MLNFSFYATMVSFLVVCALLILLILIQKGRGGGLSSAFGGAGGNTAFGSKTGDVLTWATSILFGVFIFLAVVLNILANHVGAAPTRAPNAVMPTTPPPGGEPAAPGPITANPIQSAEHKAPTTTP
ncbi:MAG TPA: preprotein translocase subunit SecG [Tepidisphaeraceae bacterium]|nr:preprotein translocase subunit SecG [Tepidisphaeraceae bacterium]